MIISLTNSLNTIWKRRDEKLTQKFQKVKQEMDSRGLLYSSETIKKLHDVILLELNESVDPIVDSAMAIKIEKKINQIGIL